MSSRATTYLVVVITAALAGLAAVVVRGDDRNRQERVRERGADVMPFSLDATTHTFRADTTGGVQTVVAKNPRDQGNVGLIRQHLREEAAAFERGDFADPASIHGSQMPGLRQLAVGHERIDVEYLNRPDGAALIYRTTDGSLRRALERWFDAQLADHGSDARRGGHSEGTYTDHADDVD